MLAFGGRALDDQQPNVQLPPGEGADTFVRLHSEPALSEETRLARLCCGQASARHRRRPPRTLLGESGQTVTFGAAKPSAPVRDATAARWPYLPRTRELPFEIGKRVDDFACFEDPITFADPCRYDDVLRVEPLHREIRGLDASADHRGSARNRQDRGTGKAAKQEVERGINPHGTEALAARRHAAANVSIHVSYPSAAVAVSARPA